MQNLISVIRSFDQLIYRVECSTVLDFRYIPESTVLVYGERKPNPRDGRRKKCTSGRGQLPLVEFTNSVGPSSAQPRSKNGCHGSTNLVRSFGARSATTTSESWSSVSERIWRIRKCQLHRGELVAAPRLNCFTSRCRLLSLRNVQDACVLATTVDCQRHR